MNLNQDIWIIINLIHPKYWDFTTQKLKKFEAMGYILQNITATYIYFLDVPNFMEICAQTHKNLDAMATEKVLYYLIVCWHFPKPLRLLQWRQILMKLAVSFGAE